MREIPIETAPRWVYFYPNLQVFRRRFLRDSPAGSQANGRARNVCLDRVVNGNPKLSRRTAEGFRVPMTGQHAIRIVPCPKDSVPSGRV